MAMNNDDIERSLSNSLNELLYKDVGSYNIIGTKKCIKTISLDDVYSYHDRFYIPDNTVLTLITSKKIPKLDIEKLFDKPIKNKKIINIKNNYSVSPSKSQLFIKYKPNDQINLMFAFPIFGRINKDELPALEVFLTILSRGFSSRLYQQIRVKNGYAYFIHCDTNFYHNLGDVSFYTNINNPTLLSVFKIIFEQLQDLIDNPVSSEELLLAKNYYTGIIFNELQTGMDYVMNYSLQYLLNNNIETIEETKKKIEAVSKEDIQNIAKKYFCWNNIKISVCGDKKYVDKKELKKIIGWKMK
jgi:predicted Zn-dependent peptidase